MADYKTLHGTNIETVSSDPSNPINGQVWYNSTDQVLKGFTSSPAGTWATSNAMNVARSSLSAQNIGLQTAALAVGGASTPDNSVVEQWNGTSWTEVGDLNTGRHNLACAGITTAGLAFGGSSPGASAANESWNGSAWTEVGDFNTARYEMAGVGTATAALAAAGHNGTALVAIAETFNGTSWSEGADLNTATHMCRGAGTSTAAVVFGGKNPSTTANSEEFTAPVETTVTFDAS